jgi:hypothetical protein
MAGGVTEGLKGTGGVPRLGGLKLQPSQWFMAAAVALFIGHVLYRLGTDFWSTEEGSHGPIVLASAGSGAS